MPHRYLTSQNEKLETRAAERDLVAQLSPDKSTQLKNKRKAEQLRQLLSRLNKRKPNE